MPTLARNTEAETARAWAVYVESLHGLEGEQYEHAESEAWALLQGTLEDLRLASPLPPSSVG